MKYTEQNIPRCTPPWDSIPWYITAFQSSPVRIWWDKIHSYHTYQTRSFRHISPGGQYLKHCQDSSWECVKVGRRGLIFKIKPRREMMSYESFSWMSLMCMLRSQLCSNFQNLSFFQFVCLQRQQKRNWYLPIIMFHLHIKAELNSPLYISGTNNKNIINMLSYFTILLHVHSRGLCKGLITTECREMLKKERRNISQPRACLCYSGK